MCVSSEAWHPTRPVSRITIGSSYMQKSSASRWKDRRREHSRTVRMGSGEQRAPSSGAHDETEIAWNLGRNRQAFRRWRLRPSRNALKPGLRRAMDSRSLRARSLFRVSVAAGQHQHADRRQRHRQYLRSRLAVNSGRAKGLERAIRRKIPAGPGGIPHTAGRRPAAAQVWKACRHDARVPSRHRRIALQIGSSHHYTQDCARGPGAQDVGTGRRTYRRGSSLQRHTEHTQQARAILGSGKLLCVEQGAILETNPAQARAIARKFLSLYMGLPNYVDNWKRLALPIRMLRAADRTGWSMPSWSGVTNRRFAPESKHTGRQAPITFVFNPSVRQRFRTKVCCSYWLRTLAGRRFELDRARRAIQSTGPPARRLCPDCDQETRAVQNPVVASADARGTRRTGTLDASGVLSAATAAQTVRQVIVISRSATVCPTRSPFWPTAARGSTAL